MFSPLLKGLTLLSMLLHGLLGCACHACPAAVAVASAEDRHAPATSHAGCLHAHSLSTDVPDEQPPADDRESPGEHDDDDHPRCVFLTSTGRADSRDAGLSLLLSSTLTDASAAFVAESPALTRTPQQAARVPTQPVRAHLQVWTI